MLETCLSSEELSLFATIAEMTVAVAGEQTLQLTNIHGVSFFWTWIGDLHQFCFQPKEGTPT